MYRRPVFCGIEDFHPWKNGCRILRDFWEYSYIRLDDLPDVLCYFAFNQERDL